MLIFVTIFLRLSWDSNLGFPRRSDKFPGPLFTEKSLKILRDLSCPSLRSLWIDVCLKKSKDFCSENLPFLRNHFHLENESILRSCLKKGVFPHFLLWQRHRGLWYLLLFSIKQVLLHKIFQSFGYMLNYFIKYILLYKILYRVNSEFVNGCV